VWFIKQLRIGRVQSVTTTLQRIGGIGGECCVGNAGARPWGTARRSCSRRGHGRQFNGSGSASSTKADSLHDVVTESGPRLETCALSRTALRYLLRAAIATW
jgi:hypothetical protein